MGMDDLMTIAELADRVQAVLESTGTSVASGRIRERPDVRTLRYYTTIGLLDRPAEMRGRTAYYARRHLVQAVAIKRLQAEGLALAEIQRRLLGASAQELEKLAAIPSRVPNGPVAKPAAPKAGRDPAFWTAPPAEPSAPPPDIRFVSQGGLRIPVAEGAELVIHDLDIHHLDDAAERELAPVLDILAATLNRIRERAESQSPRHPDPTTEV
jgi:DNA-binding transcriptional MerR regulator